MSVPNSGAITLELWTFSAITTFIGSRLHSKKYLGIMSSVLEMLWESPKLAGGDEISGCLVSGCVT